MYDYLIVGAGFAGSVLAERLASQNGKRVLLVEKRPHIGGNAFDRYNEHGILEHPYGPHVFHTNSAKVFEYLSQFTAWRQYQHRTQALVDGQLVPLPINRDTINQLYGLELNTFELAEFFAQRAENPKQFDNPAQAENSSPVRTGEDAIVSKVGRELYEKFFQNYTRKQWGLDPSELNASVTARIAPRTNRDPRYFTDRYQTMPAHGYTRMFEKMLDHPKIHLLLNCDYREVKACIPHRSMIYTGPIDEFYDCRFGPLPYRSLNFRLETLDQEWFQSVGQVNYPNDYAYTRITEFKHLTGQQHHQTTILYEYPTAEGSPYYPVPRPQNTLLYQRYQALAAAEQRVHFVGRLATYQYMNMDQVVAQALALYQQIGSVTEVAAS